MQRPLDPHSFKKSTYERPGQPWICGRAAEGCPCPLGPDQRGKCRATGECQPSRKGDRWNCTRPEARGGRCEDGPLPNGKCCHPVTPCSPVRSLRRQRGLAVALVVALTLGSLFYLLGGNSRERVLDPGELTAVHGMSSGGEDAAAHCGDCHSEALSGGAMLSAAAFAHRQLADSQLCLSCHALGEHPLQALAMSASALAELTSQLAPRAAPEAGPVVLKISQAVSALPSHGGELACATCHQEHHGRDADLTRICGRE